VLRHQPRAVGAVHVAALQLGHIPVVGEEQHPGMGKRPGEAPC
jgi:hypothetical protein